MKQKLFLILIIICNILFLFIYIHKQNWIIQLSYTKQKNENELIKLKERKKELTNQFHLQRTPKNVKKQAQKIGMKKASIKNFHKLEDKKESAHNS